MSTSWPRSRRGIARTGWATVPVPALRNAAVAGPGHAGLEPVAHRRARVRHQRPVATPPDQGLRPGVPRARCAVPGASLRREPVNQLPATGRTSHARSHRRPRELRRHRDPLRRPRRWPARGADPRLPAQRPRLGQAGPGPAGRRAPGHHLRPARVRPVQPAGHRLRLRHLRRRPQHAAGAPRPARRGPGRPLDGHRRGHPVPGPLRVGAGRQGGAGLPDPAVPAADAATTPKGCRKACSTGSPRPRWPIPRRG